MTDELVLAQLEELKKAQMALEYAVTFAQRWPQEEFKELIFGLALRVQEAAQAVACGVSAEGLTEVEAGPKAPKAQRGKSHVAPHP